MVTAVANGASTTGVRNAVRWPQAVRGFPHVGVIANMVAAVGMRLV